MTVQKEHPKTKNQARGRCDKQTEVDAKENFQMILYITYKIRGTLDIIL